MVRTRKEVFGVKEYVRWHIVVIHLLHGKTSSPFVEILHHNTTQST